MKTAETEPRRKLRELARTTPKHQALRPPRSSHSQAGRRRFDPGRPLSFNRAVDHVFPSLPRNRAGRRPVSETGRQKRLRGRRRRASLHASRRCEEVGAGSGPSARAALASIWRLNDAVSGIGRKAGSGVGAPQSTCNSPLRFGDSLTRRRSQTPLSRRGRAFAGCGRHGRRLRSPLANDGSTLRRRSEPLERVRGCGTRTDRRRRPPGVRRQRVPEVPALRGAGPWLRPDTLRRLRVLRLRPFVT